MPRRRTTRKLLPSRPLANEIRVFMWAHPDRSKETIGAQLGTTARQLDRVLTGAHQHVQLAFADRACVGMGVPLALVYPYEDDDAIETAA